MPRTARRLSPGRIATYVALWCWAAVTLFPLYWLAIASLKPVEDLGRPPRYVPFLDFTPDLSAWRFILRDPAENLLWSFLNSVLISGAAAIATVIAAGLAIYGMTRFPVKRRWQGMLGRPLLALMLATRLLPPVLVALPVYVLAQKAGLLDTRSLLIGLYTAFNLPVALLLLIPVFGFRPTPEEEAAQLDGACHIEICFGILFPMLRAPLAVTGLLVFLLCWNEYLFAAYLTAVDAGTLTPWMTGQLSMKEAQAGGDAEELSHMSAAAVLMALPALALAISLQRFLAQSLAKLCKTD
jgi:multiple sugar transport system permease protein